VKNKTPLFIAAFAAFFITQIYGMDQKTGEILPGIKLGVQEVQHVPIESIDIVRKGLELKDIDENHENYINFLKTNDIFDLKHLIPAHFIASKGGKLYKKVEKWLFEQTSSILARWTKEYIKICDGEKGEKKKILLKSYLDRLADASLVSMLLCNNKVGKKILESLEKINKKNQ
jgi:hypothetical protein